eukprot:COSAG02_NODE_1878_length_10554_cov_95.091918_8_plen_90_part_00
MEELVSAQRDELARLTALLDGLPQVLTDRLRAQDRLDRFSTHTLLQSLYRYRWPAPRGMHVHACGARARTRYLRLCYTIPLPTLTTRTS